MAFGDSPKLGLSAPANSTAQNSDRSSRLPPSVTKLPLRWILIVPFVLQISLAVGITGFLSIRNGQRAVNQLSRQLMESTTAVVHQHLDNYLTAPVEINQISVGLLSREMLDSQDLEGLGYYFWQQAQIYPVISYIGFALPSGEYIGAGRWLEGYDIVIDETDTEGQTLTYTTDVLGNRTEVVDNYEYFPLEEAWYDQAIGAGRPIWTVLAEAVEPVYVAAGITQPVYAQDGRFLGIMGTDLILSDINEFLRQRLPAEGGRLFIIERDGTLVANSEANAVLTVGNGDRLPERSNSLESQDSLTQVAAHHLQDSLGNFANIQTSQLSQFSFQGEQYFVQIMPWHDQFGLNWLVIAVVPESAFIEQIQENTRMTAILCLVALTIAIGLGLVTSHWISQPILRLSQASRSIADSARDKKSHLLDGSVGRSRIQELETLAESFAAMAEQLQASFSELEATNADLEARVKERTADLSAALSNLKRTQAQLVQTEKMSSLGQLVAGVAHEINNPVNFIHGNLTPLEEYLHDLLGLIHYLIRSYPQLAQDIQTEADAIDLDFLREDVLKILASMRLGTSRIREIVLSLRSFSRLDEADLKVVDLHEGLESTLLILQNRTNAKPDRPSINLIRQYAELPVVECYAGQMNQVFMNILSNAIDALEDAIADPDWRATHEQPEITIQTAMINEPNQSQNPPTVMVAIADNGKGISEAVQQRLFEPFFTTKSVGKGTGMGLSISYQIVTEAHHGTLCCESSPDRGTRFTIHIPMQQLP